MIYRPTLFVLGAGSSHHLGFPTGKGLMRVIINESGSSGYLASRGFDEEAGFGIPLEKQVADFRNALAQSDPASIDEFLEYNPKFLAIGKAAIAHELIKHERLGRLFDPDVEENWYGHLAQKLRGKTLQDFAKNEVAFITFNYDRSLEQYLFTTLKNFYGNPPDSEVAHVLNHIPFYHAHGQLGYLPWQQRPASQTRGYSNDNKMQWVKVAASEMKIVHEETPEEIKSQLPAHVSWAERIYFLGFGYLRANMQKLGFDGKEFREKHIFGTQCGLTYQECRIITDTFKVPLKQPSEKASSKTLTWLREFVYLEEPPGKPPFSL